MRFALLALAVLTCGLFSGFSYAADAPKGFSDAQRGSIEGIIKNYLTEHPEVIVDALKAAQKRDEALAETKSKEAIAKTKDKIYDDPATPVGGNPKGDVTVVEFYDYQCGYCKMAQDAVEKLLQDDKNVKLLYKDFPILGPVSIEASKASLAAARQGKFVKFHDALMDVKDRLTSELILKTAKDVGLDTDKLKKDMEDEAINKALQANLELGRSIGVRGTPMFIVGDQIYPGAMQHEQLKKAVEAARAAKKKS
ncbi:MAG: DsbA family protein [Alphaproteobacteria bacterium]|nr:DsbA family protein [Alphaproteobacteria bacterium]